MCTRRFCYVNAIQIPFILLAFTNMQIENLYFLYRTPPTYVTLVLHVFAVLPK